MALQPAEVTMHPHLSPQLGDRTNGSMAPQFAGTCSAAARRGPQRVASRYAHGRPRRIMRSRRVAIRHAPTHRR